MAGAQDAISRLQIQTTSPGTDDAAASLNELAAAYGAVTVQSASAEKSTASLDSKFASLEQRYVSGVKAQQDLAKVQNTVNAAIAQNPALTDRANAVLAAASARMAAAGAAASVAEKDVGKLSEVMAVMESRATGMSASMGMVGAVLQVIGPLGIAAGAALGVLAVGLNILKEQANEAGQWAGQLQHAADAIGVNTTQLQALNEAAASVGVSANDNISAFERFSVSLGELQKGSGSLYSELLKVNPALVNQLSVTKDAATGWNLLAQAYAQADKQQQVLISRAAFGRGGAAEGGVLLATAAAGGIGGLQSEDAISQAQIAQWAKLTAQINQATEAASHNFQSIFTSQILESEKAFAENMLNLSRYAKDFTLSEDFKLYLSILAKVGSAALQIVAPAAGLVASGVKSLFTPGTVPAAQSPLPPAPNFDATFGAVSKSNSDQTAASMGVQAAQAKALVAALGSVATAQERLDATTKSLNVELANHTITQETYNRAIAGAKLDAVISSQSAYMSALGQSATVADVVYTKQLQLQKLQLQNPQITNAMIQQQLALTASQTLGTFQINAQTDAENVKINMLGMSTQAGIAYQLVQTKINEAIALGKPLTTDQIAQLQQSADAFAQVKVKADVYTDALNTAKSAGAGFANDLIQGLQSGKNVMDSLTAAANNLGKQLTSSGINNIIKDPTSIVGYVETGIGILTQAVSGPNNQALKDAQLAFQKMAVDVVNFNEAAKGFDLGPLTNELQSLLSSYTTIQAAALKANDQASANQASITFGQGVMRIVQQFKDGTPALTPYADAVKKVSDEAQGLEDTLIALKDYSIANEVGISLQKQLADLAQQFVQSFTQGLQARINTASGQDYLNQVASTITQHQQDILEAQQLGISPDLVNKTFDAEIQKIVDDAGLVGDSFSDFIKQFPQFSGVVTESASALKAANDQFAALTKTISDYLNSLALGSNSTLSPQQQLQLAQSNFQQQFKLAAGGDQTALGSITQSADAYLNAGKSFYASSGGYSDIYNAVTTALQSLIGTGASSSLTGSSLTSVPPSIATGTSIPGVIMPTASVTSAANDNGALFQQQTTQLSNVMVQGFNGLASVENAIADRLSAKFDQVISAINANKGKAPRPLQAALGLKSA